MVEAVEAGVGRASGGAENVGDDVGGEGVAGAGMRNGPMLAASIPNP